MADIILKDRDGNDEIYEGITKVKFNTTDGGTQTFMEGETTTVTVEPDFSEGNMTVAPEEGMFFSEVAVKKPDTLIPGNIAKDVDVAGVVGTLEGGGENELQLLAGGANGREWEVNKIGSYMFYSNPTLTSETFTNASYVSDYAFYGAKKLTSINFPACESIGANAFRSCSILTDVSFPMLKTVGGYAFVGCSSLKKIDLPECTSLGTGAFSGLSVEKFSLPKCKVVGMSAFCSCKSISELSLPECTTISGSAIYSCSSLKTLYAPNCRYIASYVFTGCINLENVTFGSLYLQRAMNVKSMASDKVLHLAGEMSIDNGAFEMCKMSGLSLTATGLVASSAFNSCSYLKQVYTVQSTIVSYQFEKCYNLERVIAPNLESVYNNSFNSCSALRVLSAKYLKRMSYMAFGYCENLSVIRLTGYSSLESMSSTALLDTPIGNSTYLGYYGSIYVPESCLSLYLADSYWSSYYDRFTVTTPEIEALCEWEEL